MPGLLDLLAERDPRTPVLRAGGRAVDSATLAAAARRWRESNPSLAGSRVALAVDGDPARWIELLVALDGFAAELLLLPRGLEGHEKERLMNRAATEFVVAAGGAEARLSRSPAGTSEEFGGCETRWLLATSGTTAEPKIVAHTLPSLSQTVNRDLERGAAFTWGLVYDPGRFAGLQVVLQALLGGSCLAVSAADGLERQVAQLALAGTNALSATPSLWRKLLMGQALLGCALRQITLGGEIVDQPVLDALRARFPAARITQIYASTEAGVGFAVTDGRSGFPVSFLRDGVGGVALEVDEGGHLRVRPARVEQRYQGETVALTEADGSIDTGDRVRVDGDRVHFLGRANGAINVGGNKVHPEAVEAAIREVPGVEEVMVYGKQSSIIGQLVAARVVASEGLEERSLKGSILRHCRGCLEAYGVPAHVEFVDELPTSVAGKVLRGGREVAR